MITHTSFQINFVTHIRRKKSKENRREKRTIAPTIKNKKNAVVLSRYGSSPLPNLFFKHSDNLYVFHKNVIIHDIMWLWRFKMQ